MSRPLAEAVRLAEGDRAEFAHFEQCAADQDKREATRASNHEVY